MRRRTPAPNDIPNERKPPNRASSRLGGIAEWIERHGKVVDLFTTLLVGVGVAIAVNFHSSNVSRELVERQAELQLEFEERRIELEAAAARADVVAASLRCDIPYGCWAPITITNNGPATARNLTVRFDYNPNTINAMRDEWATTINDVTRFRFPTVPDVFDLTLAVREPDGFDLPGSDVADLLLGSLAAGTSVEIRPNLRERVTAYDRALIARLVEIEMPDQTEAGQAASRLTTALQAEFRIGEFRANISCENCASQFSLSQAVALPGATVAEIAPMPFYDSSTLPAGSPRPRASVQVTILVTVPPGAAVRHNPLVYVIRTNPNDGTWWYVPE